MTYTACVNGTICNQIDLQDRGLQYGDGIFETIRVINHKIPLWEFHYQRLFASGQRLHIQIPDAGVLQQEIGMLTQDHAHVVIKIIITRGLSRRGYAAPLNHAPTRIIMCYTQALPTLPSDGLHLRWCTTTLPHDPALAGMKHLNRLHQVIARHEWHESNIHDGLLTDSDGHVICATAANLFLVFDEYILTADLSSCGVAGVCRAYILQHHGLRFNIHIRKISKQDVYNAKEMFLTNAIRGVMPVTQCATHTYPIGKITTTMQTDFMNMGF